MNFDDDELSAALTAADPVDASAVPCPDNQLFEEITSMEPNSTEIARRPRTSRPRLWIAASLVAATGAGAAALVLNDNDTIAANPKVTTTQPGKVKGIEPAPRTGVFNSAGMASCMVWDVSALDGSDFAFDGTVTDIDNGWVSFAVGESFKGTVGSVVVLNAEALMAGPDGGVTSSAGEVLITGVGQRFLVSGNDGTAGVCNHTQTFSQAEADAWRANFAS